MGSLSVVLVVLVVGALALWLRRTGGAPGPRLTDDLAPEMLARAGFPVTRHNVTVLREGLGDAFLARARALDPTHATEWDRVDSSCARRVDADGTDLAGWPQRVLDEIAVVDPEVAAAVAHRCPQVLLEAVGSGSGVLGGSVFAPLARPLSVAGSSVTASAASSAAPSAALPAPRPAGDDLAGPAVPLPRAAASATPVPLLAGQPHIWG